MNTASVQQTQNSRPRWPAIWTQSGHGETLRSSGVTWLDRQSAMGGEIWLIDRRRYHCCIGSAVLVRPLHRQNVTVA